MATIKAHASSGSMLSPCDRRVGRPSIPHSPDLPTPLIYQLRNWLRPDHFRCPIKADQETLIQYLQVWFLNCVPPRFVWNGYTPAASNYCLDACYQTVRGSGLIETSRESKDRFSPQYKSLLINEFAHTVRSIVYGMLLLDEWVMAKRFILKVESKGNQYSSHFVISYG